MLSIFHIRFNRVISQLILIFINLGDYDLISMITHDLILH